MPYLLAIIAYLFFIWMTSRVFQVVKNGPRHLRRRGSL